MGCLAVNVERIFRSSVFEIMMTSTFQTLSKQIEFATNTVDIQMFNPI